MARECDDRDMGWPGYVELYESGELARRAERAVASLASCVACPRNCRVDRLADEAKVCKIGRHAQLSSYHAHFGEEEPLKGRRGSGVIFFSRCNLKCVFCQNWETSHTGEGREHDAEALAGVMIDLQEQGCHNINWVTPEHVVPQLLEALVIAVERGLRLPIVYNTSSYDALHSLALLDGVVDIYLPDFKYWSPEASALYLKARDYPRVARAAITEMHRQVGDLELDAHGVAHRGLLVRHLVMPGSLDETEEILTFLAELSPNTYVNVMAQYRPAGDAARRPDRYPRIATKVGPEEFAEAVRIAWRVGLQRLDGRRIPPSLRHRLF
jgi:putative pyruvate formate lyase activating enzyme